MNLKTKLNHHITAIVQYNTDIQAIFSDECSDNVRCLYILDGQDKHEVFSKAVQLCKELAATTKFLPVLMTISPTNQVNIKHLKPLTNGE